MRMRTMFSFIGVLVVMGSGAWIDHKVTNFLTPKTSWHMHWPWHRTSTEVDANAATKPSKVGKALHATTTSASRVAHATTRAAHATTRIGNPIKFGPLDALKEKYEAFRAKHRQLPQTSPTTQPATSPDSNPDLESRAHTNGVGSFFFISNCNLHKVE
jgi:hypothetical protein